LFDLQNSQAAALPTLFLPVEIKHREFKAKVLLATVAARAGFQVYLGSKSAVDAMVFRCRQRSGIYLYKGGKPLDYLTRLLGKVEHFVVLDEEMGPAVQDLHTAYTMRIHRGTEHLVGRLFVVGQRHRDVISEVRPELLDKVEVTGWPRIDLWSQQYQHQYGDEIEGLRRKYGGFLLFSSNFGIISQDVFVKELQHIRSVTATPADAEIYELSMKGALEDFRAFVELARRMDADPDFPKVIILARASWRRQEDRAGLRGRNRPLVAREQGASSSRLYDRGAGSPGECAANIHCGRSA
jgi:surface carbohydrate biosynthesis protein